MFDDTTQSALLVEENKGAVEQEDLPCLFKSINRLEKLGWLAVQMRRPRRGGGRGGAWQTAGILCTFISVIQHMEFGCKSAQKHRMRGCCCASADGAKAVRVPASGRWRMKWKANGKLASKFLVVFIGVRSETFDWRGCVPHGVRKQQGFDLRLLTRTRGF